MSIKTNLIVIFALLLCGKSLAADNLVLISLDGLRWQEVFRGFDEAILLSAEVNEVKQQVTEKFSGQSDQEKRQKLMPFMWSTIAEQGLMLGNRDKKSFMQVSNDQWFSYPGYNELLTGKVDPHIDSNKAFANPNVSFLEWLNQRPGFANKVAAFSSWDLFPFILNTERSHLIVNAGFMNASWSPLSVKAQWLNELQEETPHLWHNVRMDALTMGFAIDYILTRQPRVLYISLGETDDFAHDENYPEYLLAAQRDDKLIAKLWQQLQALPQYQNNTNLIITVDHGRGSTKEDWMQHGSPKAVQAYLQAAGKKQEDSPGIVGSDQVWLAAIGPDIPAKNEMSNTTVRYTNQVAASALKLLEQDAWQFSNEAGREIPELQKSP